MQKFFYIEITDTYGGEANYSWVTRHIIKASSILGAVKKLSMRSGIRWRCANNYGDQRRYDSKSGATCFFIEEISNDLEDRLQPFRFDTDDRQ